MISHFLLKSSFDKASEALKAKRYDELKKEMFYTVKNQQQSIKKNE